MRIAFVDNNTQYSECQSGDVRLVGGATNVSGVVQVCKNNAWGTMCSSYLSINSGIVICRQLGYQDGNGWLNNTNEDYLHGIYSHLTGRVGSLSSISISSQVTDLGPLLPLHPTCSGSEERLSECSTAIGVSQYSCYRYNYAAVSCFGNSQTFL